MVSRILCSLVVILLPSVSFANGLLYQLPEDGTWVSFKMDGQGTQPDGSKVTYAGSLTLSSVGKVEVDGQKCRWIEIAIEVEAKVADKTKGEHFTDIDKFLIPEKHLGKGKEPLKHVQKAWGKHSLAGDEPIKIPTKFESRSIQQSRRMLHGPFDSSEELEAVTVESKLGKLKCKGIRASEKIERNEATYDSTYTIRLHEKAPFGVVRWKAEAKVKRNGEFQGTMITTLTLVDYGTDAKSALPDAK